MSTSALLAQFLQDALAAAHEPCGLLDDSHFAIPTVDMRHHAKIAHMPLDTAHSWIFKKFFNKRESPRHRSPWMSVQKVPSLLSLVLVQGAAELDVLDGLARLVVELFLPFPACLRARLRSALGRR